MSDILGEQVSQEINVDNLVEGKPFTSTDYSQFEGKKMPVDRYRVEKIKSNYGKDGKQLPPGQTVMAPILKVETAVITTFTTKDGQPVEVRASEIFALKEETDDKGNVRIAWSPHEKGALNKFLKKMKCSHPKELKGKEVMIIIRPGKEEGQEFLGFIKE